MSTRAKLRALSPRAKLAVLLVLAVVGAAILVATGPIVRGPYSYRFPDARTILSVPYFFNVLTNIPFVVVGALGLLSLRRYPIELRASLCVLFVGIFLTGFGSAYHHLSPSNERLVFDRLPMALAFAGVFAVALGDRVTGALASHLLVPLVACAIASVIYWYGSGQLRPYVFVQGFPMVAIPLMLVLFRGRWLDGRHFMLAVGLYALAKLFALYDSEVYELGHILSGHSIKHLFAGWASWHLVKMVKRDPG